MTAISLWGPGTWLIFGIVLAPVYGMLAAWYYGNPIDRKRLWLGVSYLIGITVALWGGLYLLTVLIGVVYF